MPLLRLPESRLSTISVIAGIGNGINTATAPVWASETSKTANRGKTGMTLMVVNIGGVAVSCWMTCKDVFHETSNSN